MTGWAVAPISEVVAEARAGFACGEDPADGVFQFRMNNVTADGRLDYSKKRRVPRGARRIDDFRLEPGDVLFNATNSPELVGKSAFFPGHGEAAVFSNHFLRLRPHAGKMEGRFLARWLGLQFQRGVFRGMCRQWVNQASIDRQSLLALPIPLPPLPEQRRIAAVLDKADGLRAKRRAALAVLDGLVQSVFHEMFGDPATNPMGWPKTSLGAVISTGPQNGLYKPASHYGSGTPILRIDGFYDGAITDLSSLKRVRISAKEEAAYALRAGEIVINRVNSREYLGKSALIPATSEAIVFESNMMRFDVNRDVLDPSFLIQHLQSGFVRTHILMSAKDAVNQSSINQQDVKALPVIVPALAKQQLFSRRAAGCAQLRAVLAASLAQMEALFASLQYRAFRGEL